MISTRTTVTIILFEVARKCGHQRKCDVFSGVCYGLYGDVDADVHS